MRERWLILSVLLLASPCAGARLKGVLLIGDSIFFGTGAGGGRYRVSFQLQRELKNVFVFDYAAPGASMAWFFAPNAGCVDFYGGIRQAVNVAVIGLGVNDWAQSVPIDSFADKYEAFLQELQKNIPAVACIAPLWTTREGQPNKVGLTIADYRIAISKICTRKAAKRFFWNGLDAVPHDPRFFADGIHPNRAGHRRYARWLRDQLVKDFGVPQRPGAVPVRKKSQPKRTPKH